MNENMELDFSNNTKDLKGRTSLTVCQRLTVNDLKGRTSLTISQRLTDDLKGQTSVTVSQRLTCIMRKLQYRLKGGTFASEVAPFRRAAKMPAFAVCRASLTYGYKSCALRAILQKNAIKKIFFSILIFLGMFANIANAQDSKEKQYYNFDYAQRSNMWLQSYNGAGLRMAPKQNISYAEAFFHKSDGKFVNYYQSDNSYDFGARAEAYITDKKITYYGKIEYSNFMGKNMSGSMLINPYNYPIDFIEYTPGKKNLETYYVAGGIAYEIDNAWTIGAKINYEANHYAKRKDLRHKNDRLDMTVTAGATYKTENLTFGLNYIYRRQTENIVCQVMGEPGFQYYAFFNKGIWYGVYSLWDGGGTHLDQDGVTGFPFADNTHGAALQVSATADNLKIFSELAYMNRSGKTGEKSFEWTKNNSNKIAYRGQFTLDNGGKMLHTLRLNADYENLKNCEFIFDKQTVNGVTNFVVYGKNQIFKQRILNIGGEYELDFDVKNYNPSLALKAGYDFSNNSKMNYLMFPYTKTQYVRTSNFYVNADKCFTLAKGMINARLGAYYAKGWGDKLKENSVASGSTTPGTYAAHEADYLNREYEYLTAGRFNVTLGGRYTRLFAKGRAVYVDLQYSLTSASSLTYVKGKHFGVFGLKVGYGF